MNILFIRLDFLQARHEAANQTNEEPAQVILMVHWQGSFQKSFQARRQTQSLTRDQTWDALILRVA